MSSDSSVAIEAENSTVTRHIVLLGPAAFRAVAQGDEQALLRLLHSRGHVASPWLGIICQTAFSREQVPTKMPLRALV